MEVVIALNFPVLCFRDAVFRIKRTAEELLVVSRSLAQSDWFPGMIIVDVAGIAYTVESAVVLERARWSWNDLILNPLVRIRLTFTGTPAPVTVEEVRNLLYASHVRWHGLESRFEFPDLERRIRQASTVHDLIQLLAQEEAG